MQVRALLARATLLQLPVSSMVVGADACIRPRVDASIDPYT